MADRQVEGFFYGLFMDDDVLLESNVSASNPRRAYVDGFALRIGLRATLVVEPKARAYGMILSLTHDDLDRLYGAPGLELYKPEAVLAHSLDGDPYPALCYNLRTAPGPDEANPDYAERLRAALRKRGFPAAYISSVS